MSQTPSTAAAVVRNPDGAIWNIHGVGPIVPASKYASLEAELAAALAANQRLEKERDEARAMANLSSLAVDATFECFEEEGKNCDQLRAQIASLTAERDDLIQHFDIKQGTISDAMKRLDVQNRNTAAERDRLMADVAQYRRALHGMLTADPHNPMKSVWTAKEALATEHPGAPLVEKIGKACEALKVVAKTDRESLDELRVKIPNYQPSPEMVSLMAQVSEALALLSPFAPKVDQSTESAS